MFLGYLNFLVSALVAVFICAVICVVGVAATWIIIKIIRKF